MTPSAGLGLKPEHFDAALTAPADGLWFEVHPENYLVAGGPRLAWLEAIRARYPLALHGVGMSLAADSPPDPTHLHRLARLASRFEPAIVSEHLAWSAWRGTYLPDLLPFPRTRATLMRIADNVARVQEALRRPIAIENPSHYLIVDGHEIDEIEFLAAIARHTGCGLLLDVNNVYVSARNLGFDAAAYIDAFPGDLVAEIHVAGHTADPAPGVSLLIDAHDAPVDAAVWALFERLVGRIGPRPTLLERDGNLPGFEVLMAERACAERVLHASRGQAPSRTPIPGKRMRPRLLCNAGNHMAERGVRLGAFQDEFERALLEPEVDLSGTVRALASQRGFAVYRNTVMKGCIDALQANYPAILRLVGEEWFRAAAAVFVRAHLPRQPMLVDYGAELAAFLAGFPPAAELPYLADVARVDRFWTEAHVASDAPALAPRALAGVSAPALSNVRLHPHVSARWAWFATQPIATLWRRNRRADFLDQAEEIAWRGEGILIVRPQDVVLDVSLDAAGCAFMDACAVRATLGEAVSSALSADSRADLSALFTKLLEAGAFAPLVEPVALESAR